MALFTAFCSEARTHAVIMQGSNAMLREHSSAAAYAAADPSLAGVCGLECLCARVQSRSAAAQPRGAAEQAELEYAKGIVEYGKGNYLEALEHFRAVVDLAPDDANARFYLGLTQIRLGEFSAAIPQLEKALQLDPSLQYVHYHLGLSYFQEQRYPEALGELQRATQFDPHNAAAQFYQGYTSISSSAIGRRWRLSSVPLHLTRPWPYRRSTIGDAVRLGERYPGARGF